MRTRRARCPALAVARVAIAVATLWGILALPAPAHARRDTGLGPRDTALLAPRGTLSIGLFAPLTYTPRADVELAVHPLVFAMAPHLGVKVRHLGAGDLTLTGDYGLSLPSVALRNELPLGLRGYLTPACKVTDHDPALADSCQLPGWILVGRAGVLATLATGARAAPRRTLTLGADLAVGALLAGDRGHALGAWPWLELLLAPAIDGWRARVGAAWDEAPGPRWLRVRAAVDTFLAARRADDDRSPITLRAELGGDLRLSRSARVALSLYYWNSDTRAQAIVEGDDGHPDRVFVRSHDLLPWADVIWAF
ncbi:MAG: hypothetical protein EXR73_13675 [Myxococcales bacterium]|nr:hypothetical protein [Myxococcales bacterium]